MNVPFTHTHTRVCVYVRSKSKKRLTSQKTEITHFSPWNDKPREWGDGDKVSSFTFFTPRAAHALSMHRNPREGSGLLLGMELGIWASPCNRDVEIQLITCVTEAVLLLNFHNTSVSSGGAYPIISDAIETVVYLLQKAVTKFWSEITSEVQILYPIPIIILHGVVTQMCALFYVCKTSY